MFDAVETMVPGFREFRGLGFRGLGFTVQGLGVLGFLLFFRESNIP